jgi:hypothetical protein
VRGIGKWSATRGTLGTSGDAPKLTALRQLHPLFDGYSPPLLLGARRYRWRRNACDARPRTGWRIALELPPGLDEVNGSFDACFDPGSAKLGGSRRQVAVGDHSVV